MKPSEYNILIGVLSGIVLIIPFTGKVWDGRRTFFHRIQVRGWILIGFFLLTVFVTYLKDAQVDSDEEAKDLLIKSEKEKSDSLVEAKSMEIIHSLAKYNLTLDEKTKSIIKIVRDSAKRITNINSSPSPSLFISDIKLDSISLPDYFFRFTIECNNSDANDIDLKLYTATQSQEGYRFMLKPNDVYAKGGTLSAGRTYTTARLQILAKERSTHTFHFLFKGSYAGNDGKPIPINYLLNFNLQERRMGMLHEPLYTEALNGFKKFGIGF